MGITIKEFGNQLIVKLNTGEKVTCYPTTGGLWFGKSPTATTPTDPPPATTTGWILPVDAKYDVNRPDGDFGPRSIEGGSSDHKGVDFNGAGMSDAPISAVFNGTVGIVSLNTGAFGFAVGIDHPDGSSTFYAHMIRTPPVNVGDAVTTGQLIGNVGTTGQSTGTHLHFETRDVAGQPQVDPEPFMLNRGVTIPVT
jgi:murein DD-endopeptidase MepM/ murein hydrolase activator NlpD